MINPILKQYEERILVWATAQPSIRAVVVGGSTERDMNPADEWSDLDIEIFATDFSEFLANTNWFSGFGTLWTYLQIQEEKGPVYLVVFEGGVKVDFHFYPITELERLVASQELHASYYRGYRVVIDKDNQAINLPLAGIMAPPLEKPSEDTFSSQVNVFWYGALYVAKQIRRRNLWVVKFRDWSIKESLLKMMEWHTQTIHGWNYDTWHDGHFLSQWVDPQTLEIVSKVFGRFDANDSWQALLATIALFSKLSREVALNLNYRYPLQLDDNVTQCIRALYEADVL